MKNRKLWIWLAFSFLTLNTAYAFTPFSPQPQQLQAARLSAEVLSRYHYQSMPLDDTASSKIMDNYLKALDREKNFFLQQDIDLFEKARTKLDDAILNENLNIPFTIYNIYQQRLNERITFAKSLLKEKQDFTVNDSYQINREKAPWPKTVEEINDLWRKRVKNDWLRLKLAGKNDKYIVSTLSKRYENSLKNADKIKNEDVFQSFMNAYTMSLDPHTNYLGARASEDFDISMKLSLVGIGAVLQDKDEYTTIRELMAGSPAALSGKLKVGDRIVGVGQGENSTPVDVMGWRLDDTVALIRGAEDSVVVLDVLPVEAGPDGKHKLISLVRKKISLDKQAAKKSVIEIKDGLKTRRIGVISLPGFYQDFAARQKGDKDYRSATRDISGLLGELKKEKVDGVLMDLRNNGGGSLDEAVELTGLFIDKGPVVQQRDAKGKVTVSSDNNSDIAWDGPLGVLINRASASASEIFAAAIQDYGRGLIIGEQSFGKGTVQTVADLDQLVKNETPKFGELKMTIAQFFRINGGTTQLRGVKPDIGFPSSIDPEDFGESSYDNALPWTQIQPAEYKPSGDLTSILPMLSTSHDLRISKNKDFQYLREDIAEINSLREKNQISLNEAERRKERKKQELRAKLREQTLASDKTIDSKRKKATKLASLQDDGLLSNERNLDADLALEKARKDAKDVLLTEAANILSDEIGLLKTDAKLASSVLPKREVLH